jgi:hypothetical protein
MTKSSKVAKVAIIALIVSASQLFIIVQATNNPAAEANINAIVSNKFSSEVNPVKYYTNPDTKKGYYLIGSTIPKSGHNATEEPTSIIANKTEINRTISIETSIISANNTEPTHPIIQKAYNELMIIINNKTNETMHACSSTSAIINGHENPGTGEYKLGKTGGSKEETVSTSPITTGIGQFGKG